MKSCPFCQCSIKPLMKRCSKCGLLLTHNVMSVKTMTGSPTFDTFMGLLIGLILVVVPPLVLVLSFKIPQLENPGWASVGIGQVIVLLSYFLLKNRQPLFAKGLKFVLYFLIAGFVLGAIAFGFISIANLIVSLSANHG